MYALNTSQSIEKNIVFPLMSWKATAPFLWKRVFDMWCGSVGACSVESVNLSELFQQRLFHNTRGGVEAFFGEV